MNRLCPVLFRPRQENKDELAGRLEIVSFNLDDLPDAGESIVRGHGADWQVLRLPGGRKNPIYRAYVRTDPRWLTMSPTGQTALIMAGSKREKTNADGEPDYGRMFQSTLARQWTQPRYVQQLSSLIAGDFLVLDPMGGIDPARPPELKASGSGDAKPQVRGADSVPEETLHAIQSSFVTPPQRYQLGHKEARASYSRVVDLCRKAISAHPQAPDLWIVRNRLMIGLLGLWKADADLARLEEAVAEAEAAISAGYPSDCDVIARFCLAREALRDAGADPGEIITSFVADSGGESSSGPGVAAAALLSLDVADRAAFERYRAAILGHHSENPMMWPFTAFLLDRYHRYWLFQVPFTAGWSYGRREGYFLTKGDLEEGQRTLRTELKTLDGKTLRIPEDLDTEWTVILFAQPTPWSLKGDDGLPPSPQRSLNPLVEIASKRSGGDLKVYLATLGGEAEAIRAAMEEEKITCPVLIVSDGVDNPLVHCLGILSEDNQFNSVLLHKDGRVGAMVSGLARQSGRGRGHTLTHVDEHIDEKTISELIAAGKVEEAKSLILGLAPPFDSEAVDERGRKLQKPVYGLGHLRARARVYMALKEWDKALADAEEVVQQQLGTDGSMSLRTDELDEAEKLREEILREKAGTGK